MEGKTGTDSASTTTTLLQIATTRPNGSVVNHIVGGTVEALALSGNDDLEAGKGSKKPKTLFFEKKNINSLQNLNCFKNCIKRRRFTQIRYSVSLLTLPFYTPYLLSLFFDFLPPTGLGVPQKLSPNSLILSQIWIPPYRKSVIPQRICSLLVYGLFDSFHPLQLLEFIEKGKHSYLQESMT